jgi:hypothetical protein
MTHISRALVFIAFLITFPLLGEIRPEFFGFREGMTITELKNVAKQYSMPEPVCADLDGVIRQLNGEIVTLHPPLPIDPSHYIYDFSTTLPSTYYRGYNQDLRIYYNPNYKVIGVGISIARTDELTSHQIVDTILDNVRKGFYGKCKISRQKRQINIVSKYIYINILITNIGKPKDELDVRYGPIVFSLDCHFASFKKAEAEFNKADPLVIH